MDIEQLNERLQDRVGYAYPAISSGDHDVDNPESYIHELCHLYDMWKSSEDGQSFSEFANGTEEIRYRVKLACFVLEHEESLRELLDWEARMVNRELRVIAKLGLTRRGITVRRVLASVQAPRGFGWYLRGAFDKVCNDPDTAGIDTVYGYVQELCNGV